MKKITSLFLSIIMLFSITAGIDFSAYAAIYTGSCGDGSEGNTVAYSFDDETGVLNVTGRGKMMDAKTHATFPLFGSYYSSNGYDQACLVKEIIIGNYVESIGNYVFSLSEYGIYSNFGCPNLVKVTIGNRVTTIGSHAFYECTLLPEITIPSSVTSIGGGAFSGCSSLEKVELGSGIKELDSSTFSHDRALKTINFPANLETIGSSCFYCCTALDGDIVLGSKLSTISEKAFCDCTSLDSITITNKDCEIYDSSTTIPMNIKIYGHVGSTAQEYADVYGNEFEAIDGSTETVVAPTCTEQGYTMLTCNDCQESTKYNFVDALGHRETMQLAKAPTCTQAGCEQGYVCSVCGEVISGCEPIPATGHSGIRQAPKAPTCTQAGCEEGYVCSVCGEVVSGCEPIAPTGHTEILQPSKASTCTQAGYKQGYVCSVCGDVVSGCEPIPATGHKEVITKVETPANCTKPGLTAEKSCSVCGEITQPQTIIPLTEHKSVVDVRVEATCVKPGVTQGAHCQVCGIVTEPQQVIPAKGHDYVAKVLSAPTCFSKGVTEYKCTTCNASYQEITNKTGHNIVVKDAVAPTCISVGYTQGTFCDDCNTVIIPQTMIPMLDHNYQISSQTLATCSTSGVSIYKCTCCGDSYAQTTERLNHQYTEVETLPTCETKGYTTYMCVVCSSTYVGDEIAPLGHTEIIIPAVEPTFDKEGLTSGVKCSVCDKIIVAQQVVPRLENVLSGWVQEDGKWAYYIDGEKFKGGWMKDSIGWCYLGSDGYMATNQWIMDSVGWCYVGADGYCVTNCWMKDSIGWCYLDAEGRMVTDDWVKDSCGWCYLDANGYWDGIYY